MTLRAMTLFTRAMRQEVRSAGTYGVRFAAIGITLFLLTTVTQMYWVAARGRYFFGQVVFVNLLFIGVIYLPHFASAITEEKEERTLGLLQMTGMSPATILLGKSTSRLFEVLLLLLAQLPFTLLAVMLGGVSRHQVFSAYCTLLSFTFLVANLALLFSVLCRRTTGASGGTAAVLVAWLAGAPFLGYVVLPWFLGWRGNPAKWARGGNWLFDGLMILTEAGPVARLTRVLQTGFSGAALGLQVWSNLAAGILFFALSRVLYYRFAGNAEAGGSRRKRQRLRRLGLGRVWRRALTWKAFFYTSGGVFGMVVKGLALAGIWAVGLVVMCAESRSLSRNNAQGYAVFMFVVTAIMLTGDLAFQATQVFRDELRAKTWPALVMLPVSLSAVGYRLALGCLPGVAPHAVSLLVAAALGGKMFLEFLDEGILTVFGAMVISGGVCFIHLSALFSLRMRRGAMGVALMAVFGAMMGVMSTVGVARLDPEVGAVILAFGYLTACALTHVLTARLLTRLAAE